MSLVHQLNCLASYLGPRDISDLIQEALKEKYGMEQVDVMVLFGGSIIAGGDEMAKAIHNKIAKTYVIVGGAGHTTETFRQKVHSLYPNIETEGLTEAEIFQSYLQSQHSVSADFLECKSTNCGNNIYFLIDLLKEKGIEWQSMILMQDATMQRRMEAQIQKVVSDKTIINYASYATKLIEKDGRLDYEKEIVGMWKVERYIELLMGEVPRLRDDENGYGPKGMNFLVHVDIPEDVLDAFSDLEKVYAVRKANPKYAKPE